MAESTVAYTGERPGKVLKWRVRQDSWLAQGTLLYTYQLDNSDTILKFKTPEVGTLIECLVREGQIVNPGDPVARIKGCTHPTVMKDMCAECGVNLRTSYGKPGDRSKDVAASVAMVHSVPELIVSEEEALRLGREDEKRLLRGRKLALLVDLDQTLLHTTNDNVPACLKDVHHFQMWHGPMLMWYHTKFRPGIHHFLEKISQLYELHICTFGVRMYAHSITSLLDPQGQYFSHRILSRDECFDPTSKTANLRALFPCGDGMVAIIDDREDVWNYSPNLIPVKPYQFFDGTADINAPPGLSKDTTNVHQNGPPRRRYKIVKVLKKQNSAKANEMPKSSIESESQETPADSQNEVTLKGEEEVTMLHDGDDQLDERKMSVDDASLLEEKKLTIVNEDIPSDPTKVTKDNEKRSDETSISQESEKTLDEKDKEDMITNHAVDVKSNKEGSDAQKECDLSDSITDPSKHAGNEPMDTDSAGSVTKTEMGHIKSVTIPEIRVEEVIDEPEDPQFTGDQAEAEGNSEHKKEPMEDECIEKAGADNKTEGEDCNEYDTLMEWEDLDDYLLYLEDILVRIHKAFYDCYDQSKKRDSNEELPSLKKIIPYVRRKVLKGCNLLFSGVLPTNMPPEKQRAFITAKALGATVQTELIAPNAPNATTHVIAARIGTSKVNMASKQKGIHVVRPEWLWACSDRWEKVEEKLYQLTEENSSMLTRGSPDAEQVKTDINERASLKRKPVEELPVYDPVSGKRIIKPKKVVKTDVEDRVFLTNSSQTGSDVKDPEVAGSTLGTKGRQDQERRFSDSYNPMYAFSRDDIDDMDREVEDILNASDSDNNDSEDGTGELELRMKVLKGNRDSSSEDSLSGDFPRGWKRKHHKKSSQNPPAASEVTQTQEVEEDGEDTLEEGEIIDNPNRVFKNSDDSDSDESDRESFDESIGSVDEEMAAAVEKEFLM